jgi:hypothetical protein
MKKLYLLAILLVATFHFAQSKTAFIADTVKITFQVDMSNVSVSSAGVHMNGSWGGWGSAIKLFKTGSIYSTTLLLHPGDTIRYKFVNGAAFDWASYENPVGYCTNSSDYNNRILIVPSYSQVLKPVLYNECILSQGADSIYYTFQVDMSKTLVSDSGVWMNGSWGYWGKPVRMRPVGNIYQASLKLHIGDSIAYKFVNGGRFEWSKYELPNGPCTVSGGSDRYIRVPNTDYVQPLVCYNECYECMPDSVNITFIVNMNESAVSDSGVHLNGSWCNWSKPLRLKKEGTLYSGSLRLHPGDVIQYKFMNGGTSQSSSYENPIGGCSDSSEYNNRVLYVPSYDFKLEPVCFNQCSDCTPDSVSIGFLVNMSKVAVSDSGVYMNGSWANWSKPVRMVEWGVFHLAYLKLHPGDTIQYKYMNGSPDNWRNYENPTGPCADTLNFNNRTFIVPPYAMMLDPVCFNECNLCVTLDKVKITFQVDMRNTVLSDSGVQVNGSWCGWSNPVHLTYDGRKYFKATVEMHPGDSITYKFVNGGRFDWMKYENPQGSCTVGGAFDRILWVPMNDQVLEPVCYNECGKCLYDSVDITFMVNMSKVAVTDTGVFMNGSWGKWVSPIKLINLSSIYFGTLKLHPGDTIQYKFVNGSAFNWSAYEYPTGPCVNLAEYNNRVFIVPNDNAMVGPVCFNECALCVGSTDTNVFSDWNYYGADQLPMDEHWTQTNTGLGYKASMLQIINENNLNNILVCQSDSLHQSQVTFGQTSDTDGPFTMVARAKSNVSDGSSLGGYFEINPGIKWPNVELKLHCDASGSRYVSLSNDNGLIHAYPIDIRVWHTYWVTFDGDSLRLFVDELLKPVLTVKMNSAMYLENYTPFNVRMLCPNKQYQVSGELDFISWKMGASIAPAKFLSTKLPSTKNSADIVLFPNPTNGRIQLAGLPDENVAVMVYDATGKLLNTFGTGNVRVFELNLTDKAKGMYLVRVQTTQGKTTYKILRK